MTRDYEREYHILEEYLTGKEGGDHSAAQSLFSEVVPMPSDKDVEMLAQGVESRIQGNVNPSKTISRSWTYAAALAAAVVIAVVGIKYIPTSIPQAKTYTTANAQRLTINLADGSTIMLAPATTIRVLGRSVELSGEAVFTVENKNKEPFIVKSGDVITKVLGTTFGVRAYNSNVQVIVSEGRVGVGNTIATPGDVITVNDGKTTLVQDVDVSTLLSWTSGRIVFEDAKLAQVFAELERWYGLQFRVSDPHFATATVNTELSTQSLESVIRILSSMLNARAERTGSTITFIPR